MAVSFYHYIQTHKLSNTSTGTVMEQPTSTRSGLEQRPTHWNYGCAYRLGFHEQDWIAMSELGLGPDDVHQAKDGTVYSVTLPPRSYSDHKLQHLREFINLRCIWMNRIEASRETVELVRSWSSEWSVYAGMLRKPESG